MNDHFFKIMIIYTTGNRTLAVTSQIMSFKDLDEAESAIKHAREAEKSGLAGQIEVIRFYSKP